ncbi:serine/threonine-protein kinase [Streptomyces marincola]|uniref:serine/threonine-protein kinase n=1 Tax=Streptomyces marincola TaxID=2878388 RepID=UPI001CF2C733|nr:serine/threonine-protein kinase [Streptomyces marincola]UCM89648.1 serine/threonine protein kinase [Streptomyces marincola]
MEPLSADDPRRVGDYGLIGRLGRGGMGRVYLGRSAGGRTVAIKVVHAHIAADERFRARFAREVAAARLVGGDWTAPVLDADPEAEMPWVATGYVAGPDLHDAVGAHGPLPRATVLALGAGLAEALSAVHERGLVHRDVKPSNVLLSLQGPRLIDFGIARAGDATARLTATGVTVGSPGYMAPEQAVGGAVGPAADMFSFGAVLAYAAGGKAPFPGDAPAQLLYQVVHTPPRLDGVPPWLRDLVTACMAKDPAERPSPREAARACAGEGGAAGLMVPGWLPQPVVEDVSRRAVELLNLETAAPAGPPPPGNGASGPYPPPGPAPGQPAANGPGTTRPALHPERNGPHPTWPAAHPPTAEATRPAAPGAAGPAAGGPQDRRRWPLAVPVAAAVAAAAVAGALLTGLVGGERDAGAEPDGEETTVPAAGALPEAYVGSWSGDMRLGEIAVGPLDIVLEQGEVGERVGMLTSSDVMGLSRCVDLLTLTEVGSGTVTFDAEYDAGASRGGAGVCEPDPGELTLRLDGEVLHCTGGDLVGRLHPVG